MKSQTERPVRRPENQRPARTTKARKYSKQTAHVEARRDGKPLIFGWGGHLSHSEKVHFQRQATWIITGVFVLILVVVLIGSWINFNVIIPGLPITTVNGHQIPQSQYRKLVALKAQIAYNQINGPHGLIALRKDLEKQDLAQQKIVTDTTTQITNLNKQIKALPPGPSAQRTALTTQLTTAQNQLQAAQKQHNSLLQQISNLNQNTVPLAQQDFTQSQIGNDSATWLQDDEIIREWLVTQSSAIQAKINPTPNDINRAINAFKSDLPSSLTYDKFLSQDGVSNDDIQTMMALNLRRNNMQNYLAAQQVSPTYQVLARTISVATMSQAQSVLKQLKQGTDFGTIAKAKSLDTDTNTKGGDLGWLARGQMAQKALQAIVENWIFDPQRYINELSPVISENGDYHIVQIMGIDPSRPVDSATLKSLKNNALSDWLLTQRAILGSKVTPVDQNKLLDTMNMPPNLPASAPAPAGGVPPGVPGGGTLPGSQP